MISQAGILNATNGTYLPLVAFPSVGNIERSESFPTFELYGPESQHPILLSESCHEKIGFHGSHFLLCRRLCRGRREEETGNSSAQKHLCGCRIRRRIH